jgi:hypothetical protein
MYAIVKDGAITATASTVRKLFPNTSFPSTPNTDFLTENNVKDVVNAEQKNRTYYFVTPGDLQVIDGVPTQQYTNTAKLLADEDAKDSDGNQLYVQVWDADQNKMVNTSEKQVNRGLKTDMTNRVKTNAGQLLSHTDWMVIRKYERDVAIPSATATYRAAVITECTRLESAIAGAGDVDALATVMGAQNWPTES